MLRIKNIMLFTVGVLMNSSLAEASENLSYTYDAQGRLINVAHAGSINNNLVVNYVFDDAGNRKNVTVTGAPFDGPPQMFVVTPLRGRTLVIIPAP